MGSWSMFSSVRNLRDASIFNQTIHIKLPLQASNPSAKNLVPFPKSSRMGLLGFIYELYKFSDSTLISQSGYSYKDMLQLGEGIIEVSCQEGDNGESKTKRTRIMIKDIDRQLLDRRLMRSLEKFVGGGEYGEDLCMLQRTQSMALFISCFYLFKVIPLSYL
ncbi:hypothetical protein Tco_0788477 [Tanacetum coccineum]